MRLVVSAALALNRSGSSTRNRIVVGRSLGLILIGRCSALIGGRGVGRRCFGGSRLRGRRRRGCRRLRGCRVLITAHEQRRRRERS